MEEWMKDETEMPEWTKQIYSLTLKEIIKVI
jgi:hypothetical protein